MTRSAPVARLLLALTLLVLPSHGLGGSSPADDVGGHRWSWPVPAGAIARPFVAPATPYGAGHRGVDLAAPAGTEVRSPESGVVWFAGVVVDRPVISIRHADGLLSSFEPVDPAVATGDPVGRGQVIGTLVPGHCAAGCLHLGARIDGAYVNPLLFLGGLPRSVLLPVRRG
ncbi:MAG: M23 family metallopeptidase [Actinomycetales bacterium]|nr:M23 family metallopeptidase [Actinomycetales bacterium]